MALFDFLSGEFIDVIEWTDDTRDTMVWRFEQRGNAIEYDCRRPCAKATAVFVHEGQIADVFGPGLYILETSNMPILTSFSIGITASSPFKSEIYFVNTTRFNDLKGTKNPIIARDPNSARSASAPMAPIRCTRHRPRQIHGRDRRHRWRIHQRRDCLPAAQYHRAGIFA